MGRHCPHPIGASTVRFNQINSVSMFIYFFDPHCPNYCTVLLSQCKMESLRFSPPHPFSCCLIISDRNIWRLPAAQFHFWIIFGYELNTVYCSSQIYKKSIAVQVVYSSKVLVHCLLGGRELGGGCLEVPGILSKVGIPIRHTGHSKLFFKPLFYCPNNKFQTNNQINKQRLNLS